MDTKEVLKLAIPAIVAMFGDLDDEALEALHKGECEKPEPDRRSSLLKAIAAEQNARLQQAKLESKQKALRELASKEEVEIFFKADMVAVQERLAALEAKLGLTEERTPVAKVWDVTPIEPTAEPDGALLRVAFTGKDNVTVANAPVLTFEPRDLIAQRGGVLLTREIVFPAGGARSEVSKVWLLDEAGKGAGVVELMAPMPVGGGTSGRFAPNSLLFTMIEPEPAIEAKPAGKTAAKA